MLNLQRACRSSVHAVARVAPMVTTCALLAGSAAAQVQVTSLHGAATVSGSPLSLHAVVAENLPLEVAHAGGCSLLLADRALVQLCGGAKASFAEVGSDDPGSIQLSAGELKAIAVTHPDGAPLEVRTPTASIVLRGAEAHISVAPDSGDTVVSTLESQVSVSRRDGSNADPVIVKAGQQLTLRRGQAPGELRTVSRETLARSSSCQDDSTYYSAAVRAERAKLAAGFPTSDLQQIVTADFPPHGLPLEESSTPSALILELSKTGLDEEVCDPITCNPAYRP
jgi:Fe2+ transport system protein FeoA